MKRHAPAAIRNRGPIAEVLKTVMPESGAVLEVASGSGEHIVHFGAAFPGVDFQPSDLDAAARASVDAHARDAGIANVRRAIELDAAAPMSWPATQRAGIINCNMIHIAPWQACVGLLEGASRVLEPNGFVFLYGPFLVGDESAPSNLRFDATLRQRDPAWGVRQLAAVTAEADRVGLIRRAAVPMPANNLSLVFGRASV